MKIHKQVFTCGTPVTPGTYTCFYFDSWKKKSNLKTKALWTVWINVIWLIRYSLDLRRVCVVKLSFQSNYSSNWLNDLTIVVVLKKSCPHMHVSNYCKYLCPPLLNGGVLYWKRGKGVGGRRRRTSLINGVLFGFLQSLDNAPLISPLMCVSHHKAFCLVSHERIR